MSLHGYTLHNYKKMEDNNRADKFWVNTKRKLSAEDFENLRIFIGASNYKWTALQNGTKDFNAVELEKLGEFIGVSTTSLIKTYGLGLKNLTGKELMAFAKGDGCTVSFAKVR